MSRACKSLDAVVFDILKIVEDDRVTSHSKEDGAEYFFRGEKCNYFHRGSPMLETRFDSYLDRDEADWKHENELYQEAMRLIVASFTEGRTMCERITRMQHV
jgi:hypothetical protein